MAKLPLQLTLGPPLDPTQLRAWGAWRAQTLKRLQACPHVCRLVGEGGQGVHEGRAFLVMELLGANLAQLRSAAPGSRFDTALVQSIGACARPPARE